MAVSLMVQSGSFVKTTPRICFNCNALLPVFRKLSCVRPLKAAATPPITSDDAPIIEIEATEVTEVTGQTTTTILEPATEEKKKFKKTNPIYRNQKKQVNLRTPRTKSTRTLADPFNILKYQLTTQVTMKLLETQNTIVFIVDKRADKIMIKEAFEKMCGVRVKKVNTLVRPDLKKKAFIKLQDDQDALAIASKIGII